MGVIVGENCVFAFFCTFLHFLALFWQKFYKTLQELGAIWRFLTADFAD